MIAPSCAAPKFSRMAWVKIEWEKVGNKSERLTMRAGYRKRTKAEEDRRSGVAASDTARAAREPVEEPRRRIRAAVDRAMEMLEGRVMMVIAPLSPIDK